MADYSDQKKWKHLSRVTRQNGFFWIVPQIKSAPRKTSISEHPLKYPMLIILPVWMLTMAILTLITPWITNFQDSWLNYLQVNERIRTYLILLIALTVYCGYQVIAKLLQKRKIILNNDIGELELHYGSCLFPKKLTLQRRQFEPQLRTERKFFCGKSQVLVLRRFDEHNHVIKLFNFSRRRELTAYEKIMTFALGKLPDNLAATVSLPEGGTVTFSKAPLFQRCPVTHSLRYSFPSPNCLVFQQPKFDLILLAISGLFTLGFSIFFLIEARFFDILLVFVLLFLPSLAYFLLNRRFELSFRAVTIDKTIRKIVLAPHPLDSKKERSYPFETISALQLCLQSQKQKLDNKPGSLELNLILNSNDNQRVTLATSNDVPEIRQKIQVLAEFMGKPLIDHTNVTLAP